MILTCDGGGIRGALTARLIRRLDERLGGRLLAKTRLFVGTSIGGLLALAFAAGYDAAFCERIFLEDARTIFRCRFFGGLWTPKYSDDGRREVFQRVFGERSLGDLRLVAVTAFDINDHVSRWIANFDPGPVGAGYWEAVEYGGFLPPSRWRAAFGPPKTDKPAWMAAMHTSAAPVYFAVADGLADGAFVASNPAIPARLAFPDEAILSVGTGYVPGSLPPRPGDWGKLQWAANFIGVLKGVEQAWRVKPPYCRLDAPLPRPIRLDNLAAVPGLLRIADRVDISAPADFLERVLA